MANNNATSEKVVTKYDRKMQKRKEEERNNKMKKSCTKRYSFFCVDKSFYLDGRRIS